MNTRTLAWSLVLLPALSCSGGSEPGERDAALAALRLDEEELRNATMMLVIGYRFRDQDRAVLVHDRDEVARLLSKLKLEMFDEQSSPELSPHGTVWFLFNGGDAKRIKLISRSKVNNFAGGPVYTLGGTFYDDIEAHVSKVEGRPINLLKNNVD